MRILFISYFFPPDKSVGGYRASSIVKTFAEEDIEMILLTANSDIINSEELKQYHHLEHIYNVKGSQIRKLGYKTKILVGLELLNLDKFLFFPDLYFPWIRRAVKKGTEILQEHKVDAIIATHPPYSSAVVGYKLSKKFNIPLVLDHRDPWTNNPTFKLPKLFVRKRHRKLETKVTKHARLNVTVGNGYADLLSNSSGVERESFHIIKNGFFEENIPEKKSTKQKDRFTLSFFGNYYKVHKPFFKELVLGTRTMLDKHALAAEDFRIRYAGITSRSAIKKDLEIGDLISVFEDLGYLQGQQIIEELQKSHANFVIVPALNEYALVTKIYDYAIGNSHILIIGGEGELSDWCDSIEQKYTLVEGDRTAISDTLSKLYLQWKNNQLEYGCNEVKLAEFGRHALALKYANLIKKEFE